MRHPRRIQAREDGIARSDIRVPEAKRGRVPCRNEGEYRLPSGARNGTNYSKSGLAPEELDRTRRNRCAVRNSDNDGGCNAHVHVTA